MTLWIQAVIWTADRIKAELDQNLPIQLLQWSGTVTSNQVIDFGIPTSEGYKTNSLEVLMRLDDGKLTKAIHAIDYGYTYRDTSHIEIRFSMLVHTLSIMAIVR